jgi:hypothetical protein
MEKKPCICSTFSHKKELTIHNLLQHYGGTNLRKAWDQFASRLRCPSCCEDQGVSVAWKEIAILRWATLIDCSYIQEKHIPLALEAKVPSDLITLLTLSQEPLEYEHIDRWSSYWAVIKFSEWFYYAHVKDFPNIIPNYSYSQLTEEQCMELGATLAFYTMVKLYLTMYELSPRSRL